MTTYWLIRHLLGLLIILLIRKTVIEIVLLSWLVCCHVGIIFIILLDLCQRLLGLVNGWEILTESSNELIVYIFVIFSRVVLLIDAWAKGIEIEVVLIDIFHFLPLIIAVIYRFVAQEGVDLVQGEVLHLATEFCEIGVRYWIRFFGLARGISGTEATSIVLLPENLWKVYWHPQTVLVGCVDITLDFPEYFADFARVLLVNLVETFGLLKQLTLQLDLCLIVLVLLQAHQFLNTAHLHVLTEGTPFNGWERHSHFEGLVFIQSRLIKFLRKFRKVSRIVLATRFPRIIVRCIQNILRTAHNLRVEYIRVERILLWLLVLLGLTIMNLSPQLLAVTLPGCGRLTQIRISRLPRSGTQFAVASPCCFLSFRFAIFAWSTTTT